ncbi:hypothetical protein [Amycolatopsis sp. PS_44_ISF1]|uniref:hypothetical protein n=1 Tax=Amycolatopsis sp. PS_44_ISF1 TaxID=2974917 RepID=UPI0028DD5D51|nr:hypothetical protein [Amycolatopsis sp. PS_44_ISF1]MDT8912386.1 hypothetical protein [Amycolatopsis sp. PS_44_ISF1]
MVTTKRGGGSLPAKVALILAVMWVLIGGGWLYLGLGSGPMTGKSWLDVGIGVFFILSSGYHWVLFLRRRRS